MKTFLTSILFFFSIGLQSPQQPADKIIGIWSNEDGSVQNEIYKKGSVYEAKINKAIEFTGTVTMYKLTYADKKWKGKAFQPKKGYTANVTLSLLDDNTLLITASKAGITKTKTWKRVNP
ncbi:MAG: DUF2147 domain-containing protein [Bacteroidetes bacterium]|nr:DUF2147 domain-containing protein [Bacteroidota bacterium]